MKAKPNRLAITMIGLVLLAQTLVFGTMAVFDYWPVKQHLYQDLSLDIKSSEQRLSNSLPILLWNYNEVAIAETLESEVNNNFIEAIVIETDNNFEYQVSKVNDIDITTQLTDKQIADIRLLSSHPLFYKGDDGEGNVGKLYILSNDSAIRQQLSTLAIRLMAQSLLLNLSLAVLIFIILYKLVIRPVHQTSQGLEKIVSEGADLSKRLTGNGVGELAELSHNYNKLADYVSAMLQEREHALEKAEESAKLKSEFLASMSHEIRTPMNGVLGMLDLLLNGKLNKQQRHYATLAHSSASSLLVIINDILDFSKIEAGKLEIEHLEFDVRHLIGEIAESIATRAQDKGLHIILDLHAVNQTLVYGDPARLRQVLTNILGNAIKFTHEGEITIRANLRKAQSHYYELQCDIEDTGIGISEEKQHLLFDSFSQVDASTTREYGGTGLGLAIVNQLCLLMGGSVSVSSTVNKGSCFTVNLMVEKSPRSTKTEPSVSMAGKNILLAEGNAKQTQAIKQQLEQWQCHLNCFSDISEILQQLKDEQEDTHYDLLIGSIDLSNQEHLKTIQTIDNNFPELKKALLLSMSDMGKLNTLKGIDRIGQYPKPVTMNDYESLFNTAFLPNSDSPNDNDHPSILEHTERDKRILLVEDNMINQQIALANLEAFGFQVDLAENGLEALKALKHAQEDDGYDLVFMDCQMPEMDGYAATKAIRKGKANNIEQGKTGDVSMIPIVAMTANAMKGDREKCIAAGMDDYLSKPIDPDELESKLNKWLG